MHCPMCGDEVTTERSNCPSCGEPFDDRPPDHLTPLQSQLLERFRRESHGLAVFWILLGGLSVIFGGLSVYEAFEAEGLIRLPRGTVVNRMAWILIGIAWVGAGFGTGIKRSGWVTVGLAASYVSVFFSLNDTNSFLVLPQVMNFFAILQGHRLLRYAKQLTRREIKLTRRD